MGMDLGHVRAPTGYRLDLAVISIVSFGLLVVLVLWLDNAETLTSNGVFKAVTIKTWIADPANAKLDTSNYLYYPFMAVLCRLLDLMGVYPGDPRHQLTIINAFSASLCLAIVYLLVRRITGNRAVAWAATLFHLASAFFLNLAISNEDIMPSYAVLLASMALASVWFVEPSWRRVSIVATLFTLAWMLEWRLMFPTLPALILALAVTPGRPVDRLGRIALFLAVMVGLAEITMLLWGPQNGNAGAVQDLLWTGKGVASGWAGFAARKFTYLWVGVSEYLVGGSNVGGDPPPSMLPELWFSTFCIATIAAASLALLWRDRALPSARVLATVFGGTFAAGEVMNLYSQPQDPQMQVNVMVWLTMGWAIIVAAAVRWRPVPAISIAVALSVALFGYNIWRMAPQRGAGSAWRLALERIEKAAPPANHVFLLHGFEQLVSEMFYAWDGDWDYFPKLGPAPSANPKFKYLAFVSGPVHKPNASGTDLGEALRDEIDRALNLGYVVIASDTWAATADQFAASMATVLSADKAKEFHKVIHDSFLADLVFTDPGAGRFYRIRQSPDWQKPNAVPRSR
ncbi:MAG: hypothetical protein K2Y40_15670 [Reyranella sp.]|nr:hypothetical protein [Reyranella sp.]